MRGNRRRRGPELAGPDKLALRFARLRLGWAWGLVGGHDEGAVRGFGEARGSEVEEAKFLPASFGALAR
jgi:hypothetical protein